MPGTATRSQCSRLIRRAVGAAKLQWINRKVGGEGTNSMEKQKDWIERIKDLPGWIKGVISITTLIITFVILFRDNLYLSTTVSVAIVLTSAFCFSLYVVFSRRESKILGGGRVYRYGSSQRRVALVVVILSPVVAASLLVYKPTRSWTEIALAGTPAPISTSTPTATPFLDWNDTAQSIVEVFNLQSLNPIANAITTDGRTFPMAHTVSSDYMPKPEDLTGFATRSCVTSFDLNAIPEEEFTRIDEVIVRVNDYEIPPPISDVSDLLPAFQAHLVYVQIDAPEIAGKSVFEGTLANYSPAGYLVLEHGSPERMYVMVGALTPGVYDFDIGIVASYRDVTKTHWIASRTIYFVGESDSEQEVALDDPIAVLESKTASFEDQMRAIRQIGDTQPPGSLRALEEKAKSGGTYVSITEAAAETIGELDDPEAVYVLIQIISNIGSDDLSLYSGAVSGLGHIDSVKAITFLIECLEKEQDDTRRRYIIREFGNVNSVDVVPVLLEVLQKDSDEDNREEAIMSLIKKADSRAEMPVIKALQDDESDTVRGASARALASFGKKDASILIRDALLEAKPYQRRPFILALTELGDTKSVGLFIELLKDYMAGGNGGYPEGEDTIINALTHLTGEHFGYLHYVGYSDSAKEYNNTVIKRWIDWWDHNPSAKRYQN